MVSVATVTVLLLAGPAYASCAAPASASAHQFTGLVLSTSREGRDAQVRTVQGTVVEVVGTPANGDEHTTVDRTYQVNAWYVFDPGNATSPYLDDICTATHLLAPGHAPSTPVVDPPPVPHPGLATWPWAAGGAGALVVLGSLGVGHWTRRHRSASDSSAR